MIILILEILKKQKNILEDKIYVKISKYGSLPFHSTYKSGRFDIIKYFINNEILDLNKVDKYRYATFRYVENY